MMSLRFSGMVSPWTGLLLAVVCAVLCWRYYKRDVRELRNRLRWLLPLLRCLALVMILLILCGPILHHRTIVGEPGRLTIYLDGSRSMELRDEQLSEEQRIVLAQRLNWLSEDQTDPGSEAVQSALVMVDQTPRWQRVATALLGGEYSVLDQLSELHHVDLQLLRSDETIPISFENTGADGSEGEQVRLALLEDLFANPGETSDLAEPLSASGQPADESDGEEAPASGMEVNEERGSQRGSVALLITDGQHNTAGSPIQAAQDLGTQGVRLYSVAVGAAAEAADLAVLRVDHPDRIFRKDELRGEITLRDRVPAGKPFVVQVRHADKVLWQDQQLTQNVEERRIPFAFSPEELLENAAEEDEDGGQLESIPVELEVSVSSLADESETSNNMAVSIVSVVVQSYQVLLLDGRSRWETRYLKNVFERDDQWQLNALICGPGTEKEQLPRANEATEDAGFPATRDELFAYDLIVLGEIEPTLLSRDEQQWLRDFVEIRGGGLILIDGQRGLLRQFPSDTIGPMIPVDWPDGGEILQGLSFSLTDRGASDPSLLLQPDELENRGFWGELPAPQGLIESRALPGAEVLVEVTTAEGTKPGLVTHLFGAGRVLYFAFDETWRWRYKVADTWHQRIWNQLSRAVMPRPFAVSNDYVSIDTGGSSFESTQEIDLRIALRDLEERPADGVTADALISRDGRVVTMISLNADGRIPGIYRGRISSLPPGEYEVRIQADGYSDEALQVATGFTVRAPISGELAFTSANRMLLERMSDAAGGRLLEEEEIGDLPELLSAYSDGRIVESETLLWQSYWWFLPIVSLLSLEWMLRRRAGLM